jgi:hypothetical protein
VINNDTAPSVRSARWSGHGFLSRSITASQLHRPGLSEPLEH